MTTNLKKIVTNIAIGALIFLGFIIISPMESNAASLTVLVSKNINHMHHGTANSTSPNGCYKETYQSYEQNGALFGYHEESRNSVIGYCNYCGQPHWVCGSIHDGVGYGTHQGGYTSYENVANYGNVTRYKCIHENEKIAEAKIYITGSKLMVEWKPLWDESLSSKSAKVNWSLDGSAIGSGAFCAITKAGTYTCSLTFTDPYGGQERSESVSYVVTYSASITVDKESSFQSLFLLQKKISDATFTASTIGGTTTSYQWYKNGSPIDGATKKTYTATSYGTYYCKTTSSTGIEAESNHITAYIGNINVKKETSDGTYRLQFESQIDDTVLSFSFGWIGTDNDLSTHINGAKPSDVNSLTTSSIIVPDFGQYVCNVTVKDSYLNNSNVMSQIIDVEDFDLEPPTITEVAQINFDDSKLTGIIYDYEPATQTFKLNNGAYQAAGGRYKQWQGFKISIEDNMALDYYEIDGVKTTCSGNAAYFANWYNRNKTITIKVVDKIGNSSTYKIEISHVDTTPPIIEGVTFSTTSFTNKDITATINATDDCALEKNYRYLIVPKDKGYTTATATAKGFDNTSDYFKKNGFQKEKTFTLTDSHDYYVYVTDEAGNVSSSEFNVDWIDKNAPDVDTATTNISAECNNITYSRNGRTFDFSRDKDARFVTIHFSTTDKASTLSVD